MLCLRFNKVTQRNGFSKFISTLAELEREVESLEAAGGSLLPGLGNTKRREIVSVIQACADLGAASLAERIHSYANTTGLARDVFVANILVSMYIRCGKLQDARSIFDSMPARDCILWTTLITAYGRNGDHPRAFLLFRQMQQEGAEPDSVTLATILNICSEFNSSLMNEARDLHCLVAELGLIASNPFIGTALINLYGRSGNVEQAGRVFDQMKSVNTVPWNAMITALAANGLCGRAMQVFWEMLLESIPPTGTTFVAVLNACSDLRHGSFIRERIREMGFESDVIVATALLNMFGKFEHQEHQAAEIFLKMQHRNVITWNAMIALYSHNDLFEEAFSVFSSMQLEGVKPSLTTFLAVLPACDDLSRGEIVHGVASESRFDASILVSTALVEMYSRVGKLEAAIRVFESVRSKDVILWNSIIAAFGESGRGDEAVRMFNSMQCEGVAPDRITFLTLANAISSSSVAGVDHGKVIHQRIMKLGLEKDPMVGTALVNMCGKCGDLDAARVIFNRMGQHRSLITWNAVISSLEKQHDPREAMLLFKRMQLEGVQPDRITFLTILSSCSALADLVTGSRIHALIGEKFDLSRDRMLQHSLLNMYCKSGGSDEARRMMEMMKGDYSSDSGFGGWNLIISASASHGSGQATLKLLHKMQQEGGKPGDLTFVSVLTSCSRAGLVEEGLDCWRVMAVECGLEACEEHYGCLVDLLGRAGKLGEAEEVMKKMRSRDSNSVMWMSLAGASKLHGDGGRARRAAERAICADAAHFGAYVALVQMR